MPRPTLRALVAAAVVTTALVAVPEAAFANHPGPDQGGAVSISAVIAAPASTAASAAPRVATVESNPAVRKPAAKPAAKAPRSSKPASKPASKPTPAPAPTATPTKTAPPVTGSDISYPQCSLIPRTNQLFGVIGINGGTAREFNPCLSAQFAWAANTAGTTPQGTASVYINTANPGKQSSWWPASDTDRPAVDPSAPGPQNPLPTGPVTYPNGSTVGCSPAVDPYGPACSYVYGYVRAEQAVEYAEEQLGSADVGRLRWWLDVETSNTWAGPVAANAASLAGAATALTRTAPDGVARVGVYSTTAQYKVITGGTGTAIPALPDNEPSPLAGLPEWGAGASDLKGAQSNCGATPFTGGPLTITQYESGSFDYDVSCGGY